MIISFEFRLLCLRFFPRKNNEGLQQVGRKLGHDLSAFSMPVKRHNSSLSLLELYFCRPIESIAHGRS